MPAKPLASPRSAPGNAFTRLAYSRQAPPRSSTMPVPPSPADALLLQLLMQQESERHAVGRALHNQVGQALSAIKMTAHLTLDENDAEQRRQDLQDIVRTSDDTVAVLRELHATLHPPQLESLGLEAALRAESDRIAGGQARLETAIATLPSVPAPTVALVAFRIGQSLARHASAAGASQPARLSLAHDDADAGDGLLLRVHGALPLAAQDALLLQALARAAGGSLSEQPDGHGIVWRLRLPYAPAPTSGSSPA